MANKAHRADVTDVITKKQLQESEEKQNGNNDAR